MSHLTLLDLAKRKGADGFYENVLTAAPELSVLPVVPRNGIDYRITKRTGHPSGGFRDANGGIAETKSTYVQDLVMMYFWDCPMFVDEAIVTADDGSSGDLLMQEERGAVRNNLISIGSQIYDGTSANAKGFKGLFGQVDSTMVVDAEGSGSNACHDVWMVYANGDDPAGLKVPFSNRSELTPKPWRLASRQASGLTVTGFESNLAWWLGLDIGSEYSIGVIKNVTDAEPLTDALGEELRAKFPAGRKPNLCFMSPTSRFYLQKSRSAVGSIQSNSAGGAFSPLPEYLAGAQIVETDSIGKKTNW